MQVRKLLKPFVELSGIVGMDDPYHYRNKVHAAFAHVKDGKKERNVAGIYEEGTHKVVPVTECLIEDKKSIIRKNQTAFFEQLKIVCFS